MGTEQRTANHVVSLLGKLQISSISRQHSTLMSPVCFQLKMLHASKLYTQSNLENKGQTTDALLHKTTPTDFSVISMSVSWLKIPGNAHMTKVYYSYPPFYVLQNCPNYHLGSSSGDCRHIMKVSTGETSLSAPIPLDMGVLDKFPFPSPVIHQLRGLGDPNSIIQRVSKTSFVILHQRKDFSISALTTPHSL